jgi:hypothetical protein
MNWITGALGWISAILILASSVSGLFQDFHRSNSATGKRSLTRSGWIHVAALAVGFVLFGATQVAEWQKRRAERIEADNRAKQQQTEIDSLSALREAQLKVEDSLKEQIKAQRKVENSLKEQIVAERLVAELQNQQLRHILLTSYQLAGFGIELPVRNRTSKLFDHLNALRPSRVVNPAEAKEIDTIEDCVLRRKIVAKKDEKDSWQVSCWVQSGAGYVHFKDFECPPKSYGWRVIEAVLDQVLGYFAIRFDDGAPFAVFTAESRPSLFDITPNELTLEITAPPIKLSQLVNARLRINVDSADPQDLPEYVALRSRDPMVSFNERINVAHWKPVGYMTGNRLLVEWFSPLHVEFDKRFSLSSSAAAAAERP